MKSSFGDRVMVLTRQIPRGGVASYGLLGALAGAARAGRMVGRVLHHAEQWSDIPWWRVVNRDGCVSTTCEEHPPALQKKLLEKEGLALEKRDNLWCIKKPVPWIKPEDIGD